MNAATPRMSRLLHGPQHRRHWGGLLALLLVVVSAAALAPGHQAPTLGLGDKLNHLAAFVALGLAAALAQRPRRAGLAGVALLAYGGLIEVLQTQVPGRHGDLADLLVDAVGIAVGLALAALLRRHWPASRP